MGYSLLADNSLNLNVHLSGSGVAGLVAIVVGLLLAAGYVFL